MKSSCFDGNCYFYFCMALNCPAGGRTAPALTGLAIRPTSHVRRISLQMALLPVTTPDHWLTAITGDHSEPKMLPRHVHLTALPFAADAHRCVVPLRSKCTATWAPRKHCCRIPPPTTFVPSTCSLCLIQCWWWTLATHMKQQRFDGGWSQMTGAH